MNLIYKPFKDSDPAEMYPDMAGGIDTLLNRKFLQPGGRSFKVGPDEKAAVMMCTPGTKDDPFNRVMAYGEALRRAARAAGLTEGGPNDSYRIYRGDSTTLKNLALQAAAATDTQLHPAFVNRVTGMAVNELTHQVSVYFTTEA
jgi:hypothetical protein